jgi:hypothetical protein
MHVMLDDEEWNVKDDMSLMEILAQVSDKAHAKQRVITSLQLGSRRLTDRNLTGDMLAQAGAGMGPVRALTQSMDQLMDGADETMGRFATLLKVDGAALVQALRTGQIPGAALDAWLGRLADYLECVETKRGQTGTHSPTESLMPWVCRLVDARIAADWVALADLVEYEIVSRLPG